MQMITQSYIPSFMEILTCEGWAEIDKYNNKDTVLILNPDFKIFYIRPKEFSNYHYKGELVQIESEVATFYVKPNVQLHTSCGIKKAKELIKGDLLSKYYMWNKVSSTTRGEWEGKLYSIFFGEDCLLPVKFEQDYCLIKV